MQKLFLKFAGIAMVLTVLLVSSCEEDDPIVDNPLPPVISLLSDAGFISSDAEVDAGTQFMVKIEALPGDNPLQAIEILEDGTQLSTDRFAINSGGITSNNPFLITGTDKDGATYEITIDAVADFDQIRTYTFIVSDERLEEDEVSIDITTKGDPGTPVTEINGVLLNQAGPAGTGGLDLDTGDGTGSNDAAAEIQDEGINKNVGQDVNWRQQISGVNGSELRTPDLDQLPEGFDFETVTTVEQIVDAWNTGKAVAGDDSLPLSAVTDGEANEEVTEPLTVGDLIIVKNGDNYYMVRVDEINIVYNGDNQPGNNDDNYVLSIKK